MQTFEQFLLEQAEEHRRLLELTEELGLRRLGYVQVADPPADQIVIDPSTSAAN